MKVTQRQIAETISGLRLVAKDLWDGSQEEPIPKTKGRVVPIAVSGLQAHSEFLERVSQELLHLLDDDIAMDVIREDEVASEL